MVAKCAKALGFGSEDSILKELREDSESPIDLLYEFTLWANRASLTLVCFFEQHITDYGKRFGGVWKELVVGEASACLDGHRKVPLATDHVKINKYSGPNDPSYVQVYPFIVGMAQQAVQVVQCRLNPQSVVEDRIPHENIDCLQSLFLSNPLDDLAAIRSAKGERVSGTCEWILTQGRYTSWIVEDSPQLLWLSGGPGIGKTMISSFLVGELAQLAERSSQRITLAYFFCDDKDEVRKTATAILRGLLLQILRQRPVLFKYVHPDFALSRDSLFTNFHALWRIFVSVVEDKEVGMVYCLIDALDECETESRRLLLTDFANLFRSQQTKKMFVKFIVTSRRETDIEESLSTASPAIQNLQVDSGRINDDLYEFINVKVEELSTRKRYSADLKEMIKGVLTEKAGGTFLYVSLVLDDLSRMKAQSLVRKKLQELPLDLNKLYDKILTQVEVEYVEVASSILQWVAVARRPLTAKELAMVRFLGSGSQGENITPSEDLLNELKDDLKCCGPLVYYDTINDTINLVHQSAKEYLLGEYLQASKDLSHYHIVLDRTNLLIFKTCWTYLSREEFEEGRTLTDGSADRKIWQREFFEGYFYKHCLLQYAIQEWQEHALAAVPALVNEYNFREDTLNRLPTLRDAWVLRAAAAGQETVVQRLLENGAELEARDKWGRTPLLRAAEEGHATIVMLLLKNGAELEARNQWVLEGQTSLSLAAGKGRTTVVMLLLEDGAELEARDLWGRTPLSQAAEGGDVIIVTMFLKKGAELETRDEDGWTPLFWAVRGGHAGVITLLLKKGAELDAQDNGGRTSLSWAAQGNHAAIVTLLLKNGAKLE
ncbi:MAG: hypothetical protein ASARMPRED_008323 [Alectoria sarmentosa]|nr:MAG: hypothetical protein ASARMPRED_008323 [Alectoria sarmentosa]